MSPSDEHYKIVCKLCGAHNEPTAVFCANATCGAFLEWEGEVVGPPNVPPTRQASPMGEVKWVDGAQQATATTTTEPPDVSPSPAGPHPRSLQPDDHGPAREQATMVSPTRLTRVMSPTKMPSGDVIHGSTGITENANGPMPSSPGLEDFSTTRQPSPVPPEFYLRKRQRARRKRDESGPGEQDVVCPRCHKGNSARRYFCRHCGASLSLATVDAAAASPAPDRGWRRLLRRVLPPKKAEVPGPAAAPEPASADSAGKAGHSAPSPAGTPQPRLPSTVTQELHRNEPRLRAAPAPPYLGAARVSTLPKPVNTPLSSPGLLAGRAIAILVAAGAILLLAGSQIAVHGLRGEVNRVRSFFYPHYGPIPVKSDLATNLEGCYGAEDGPGASNLTTTYWFTPAVTPSGDNGRLNSSELVGAPLLNVVLSRGDVARVGVTPVPVANAPVPLELAIMVDNSRIQRITLPNPPTFQTFSVHDGTGGARVEIWLLSTGGRPSSHACALTAITFYARS